MDMLRQHQGAVQALSDAMQRNTRNEKGNFAVVSDMHRDPCKLYGAPTFSAITDPSDNFWAFSGSIFLHM